MHIIWSETFDETPGETFWHEKSRKQSSRESRQESCRDSWWHFSQDCWRDFPREKVSPRVSDRIICMTADETLSETRFFYADNASGKIASPLTLFEYVRLPKACIKSAPTCWGIGRTENGWMTCAAFYEYFANVFHPYVLESNIPLPVIVILDGHGSHYSYDLSNLYRVKSIILCCLPLNATHILQPLDVVVFSTSKAALEKVCKILAT